MVRVGIMGGAGYTGGELLRVLVNHPAAEIVFVNSRSNAGKLACDIHEGLVGDTDIRFTEDMPFGEIDVLFLCFGHGKSREFVATHDIPRRVKIIDLAQDFRIAGDHDYVYGLPEAHREKIRGARRVANPGCFATCIQLALLPALKNGLISGDIHVNGITGATGAGREPSGTTHYPWRNDNISIYKAFTHQHLSEIRQTIDEVSPGYAGRLLFIPQRGCFARGIFVSAYATCRAGIEEVRAAYDECYNDEPFTHHVLRSPSMKEAVNTNKAVVYVERFDDRLLMVSAIDNLLKGAVGQAVQNMNIMFGLDERAGLCLKATAF